MRQALTLLLALGCLLTGGVRSAWAADSIQLGALSADPPTLCCIGLDLPIAGDDNYDASATVEYRRSGDTAWQSALPLLRVRPDTVGQESPPGSYGQSLPSRGFAGSIFGLEPGTAYEIRVSVVDPDLGGATATLTTSTRNAPRSDPLNPRFVDVASDGELVLALGNAQPGDVIRLAPGTYTAAITLAADGTEDDPIVLRGASAETVTIDGAGRTYGVVVSGSHVHVEQVSVASSFWGARLSGSEGVIVRHSTFRNVGRGIDARGGTKRGYYLCDNVLEGPFQWPDISNATWDEEGIVISGQGHTVCYNTVSGFGDAIGLSQDSAVPNVSVDFYGNDVLWSGDDGIEMDYGYRNVRAFANRLTNTSMGVSVQPGWGGPLYIVRNVLINQASSPYKLNNDPSGILIYNNTSVRSAGGGNYGGAAWPQIGYQQSWGARSYVANFEFLNNIVIGTTVPAKITSQIILGRIDGNGWYPDGTFEFYDGYSDLQDVQSRSGYEQSGVILNPGVFAQSPALGPDYTSFVEGADVSLSPASNAIDSAFALPNVSDAWTGSAPDLGAHEYGFAQPHYGVRSPAMGPTIPKPPTLVEPQ